jgi:flagellar L-ring protein precursor FlgH
VQARTGSIYQAGYDIAFFEDIKARRIGDILTIQLTESTNASKSSSTDIGRDQNTTITNPTILGATPQFSVPGVLPLNPTSNNSLESSLSSSNEFEGGSDSELSNSLTGDITVTIADVLPNGNLVVRGEKRLNLNQGNEYIKISGIVRPVDINVNNTVPSTKVADATIVYSADGAVADANKAGWLARFFISAAFPF